MFFGVWGCGFRVHWGFGCGVGQRYVLGLNKKVLGLHQLTTCNLNLKPKDLRDPKAPKPKIFNTPKP